METTTAPGLLSTDLSDLKQRAINAHNWTSFDPEKRGEQLINEFTQELIDDLKEIETASEGQKAAYISKFRSLLSSWISAKSNCMSSMITGPARFPTRRAEKANRSEQNKYELLTYWRKKAKKAILKSLEPEKTYETEIERYKKDLTNRLQLQQLYKDCNAIIRKAKGQPCTEALEAAGLSHSNAIKIQTPDWGGRIGFASFHTSNNLANIHRIEGRIKELEAKEQKAGKENEVISFQGGKITVDYSIDRILIQHDSKPERSVIDSLKGAGFHWAPSQHCWMRQITGNAMYATRELLRNTLKAQEVTV